MRSLTRIILLICLLMTGGYASVRAAERVVCASCEYKTIKSAIDAAQAGDIIRVKAGTYKEGALVIQKRLHLIGEGLPVIDGEGKYEMMLVKADSFRIEGFSFRNSGSGNIQDIAAIKIVSSRGCQILNNHLHNNFFGIYLASSHHCRVEGNTIKGVNNLESNSGNGIHFWKCDSSIVQSNKVQGHRDGLYFEFTTATHIRDNISEGNIRYGLHFMFSNGNTYEHNIFRRNGAGVAVMYTHTIIMRGNLFEHNWGGSAYGLLLKSIDRSLIEDNLFLDNTTGLHMESSGKLMIRNNIFRRNGFAVKVMSSSTEDTFVNNNFIANSFDIGANGTLNANHFQLNYWDKYKGYDLNRDKIGDVPYNPVSLFSMIMEEVPNSVMLMHSMVAGILDQVEKVNPEVIPAELQDKTPRMKENILMSNPWNEKQQGSKHEKTASGNRGVQGLACILLLGIVWVGRSIRKSAKHKP